MARPEGSIPTFNLQELLAPPAPLPAADPLDKIIYEFATGNDLPANPPSVKKPNRTVSIDQDDTNTIGLRRVYKN